MVEVYPPGLVTSTTSWSERFSFQPAVVSCCHAAVMYSVGIVVGKKIGSRLRGLIQLSNACISCDCQSSDCC